MPEINLELEVCGGCNEKIGIKDLSSLLKDLNPYKRKEITVGFDGKDDACVYKINEDISLVESLDFFSTMVKNPYDFGRIASTNAISDIYAMGGEPKFALNIVCFPEGENLEILKEILRGAEDICREAEVSISGGHSIHDRKIKFGQCVTGLVKNNEIWTNKGAEVGDYFILTKPLGVSLLMSAYSVGETSEENYIEAIKNMTTLNKYAAEILKKHKVSSVTDVTGFGLIGHLDECTEESVEIFADEINF
ncbi:selenide, water dikinase SelD, partial [uncultured Peptoniphilus sp.]